MDSPFLWPVGFGIVAFFTFFCWIVSSRAESTRKARLKRSKERYRNVHKHFEDEFKKRKKSIGKIVCPQCQWTGEWGEGMSYQEFFAYEIRVKHKVEIDETLIRDADNLSNESQFKCPMCKSTNWQKV